MRTYSLPASASAARALRVVEQDLDAGRRRTRSTTSTSQPVSPSTIWPTIPPTLPADRRPRLPERLADRQAEALPDRLLEHGRRVHLERVHLDRADVVQVREDVDVRVAVRVGDGLVVEVPALGIVVRHRADERELHVRDAAPSPARYASITPSGSFHGSKRETCVSSGRSTSIPNWSTMYAASSGESAMFFGASGSIAGGQMNAARQAVALRHVLAHVEDRRVVAPDRRQQEVEHLLVRRREVDVAAPDPVRARRREVVDHRRRLRVVDDHEVVLVRSNSCGVQLVVAPEDLLLLVVEAVRVALERVVDRLRDVEELVRAADDPPLDVEARVGISGTSV